MNISTPPLYLSVCTKTRKWAIMYMCGGGIDFHFVSTITISDFFFLLHFIDFLEMVLFVNLFWIKTMKTGAEKKHSLKETTIQEMSVWCNFEL
jgi:hypothetical protein